LPIVVISNAIAKFNNLGDTRKIIAVGLIQTVGFLVSFVILVPHYGTLGGAYSILIAYTFSAAFAIFLSEGLQRRYIANSVVAVIIGSSIGYAINSILDNSLSTIVSSVVVTLVVLLALRNTSISELRALIRRANEPEAMEPYKKRGAPIE
jgi:uncharacterized membrane protein YfcA